LVVLIYAPPVQHGAINLIHNHPPDQIKWNSIGTLLAVNYGKSLEIWREGNYHWYRQINFNSELDDIWWDELDSSKIWILQKTKIKSFQIEQYINNYKTVITVSDGENINYTDYKSQSLKL